MTNRSDADRGAPQQRRTRSRLATVLAMAPLVILLATAAVLGVAMVAASSTTVEVAQPFDLRAGDSQTGSVGSDGEQPLGGVPAPSAGQGSAPSPKPGRAAAGSESDGREEPPTTDESEAVQVPVTSGRLDDVRQRTTGPVPVRLIIPSIGVDAEILPAGYRDGEMEVPPTADTVGWYEYGPVPGDEGSAVLAAHVAWRKQRGVFWDLNTLAPGAEFEVVFDDGTSRAFRAVALDVYEKGTLPSDEIFRRAGDPVLTLITCGGAFNPSLGNYDSNVVALAVEVDEAAAPADLPGGTSGVGST